MDVPRVLLVGKRKIETTPRPEAKKSQKECEPKAKTEVTADLISANLSSSAVASSSDSLTHEMCSTANVAGVRAARFPLVGSDQRLFDFKVGVTGFEPATYWSQIPLEERVFSQLVLQ